MVSNRSGIRDSKLLDRNRVHDGLIEYAAGFVEKRATIPSILKDPACEREVHQAWDGEMPILVQTFYADGLSPADFRWFTSDYMNRIQEITSPKVLTITPMQEDEGRVIAL